MTIPTLSRCIQGGRIFTASAGGRLDFVDGREKYEFAAISVTPFYEIFLAESSFGGICTHGLLVELRLASCVVQLCLGVFSGEFVNFHFLFCEHTTKKLFLLILLFVVFFGGRSRQQPMGCYRMYTYIRTS